MIIDDVDIVLTFDDVDITHVVRRFSCRTRYTEHPSAHITHVDVHSYSINIPHVGRSWRWAIGDRCVRRWPTSMTGCSDRGSHFSTEQLDDDLRSSPSGSWTTRCRRHHWPCRQPPDRHHSLNWMLHLRSTEMADERIPVRIPDYLNAGLSYNR